MSSYEEKIVKILKTENIKFIKEKSYPNLNNGKFRFDFYIPAKNIIVEVDGQYHWQPIRGRAVLLKQQEHDRIKNSYCLVNDIALYRVPYWEISSIKKFEDIIQKKYLVSSKWHNDHLWKQYQKNK